MQVYPNRLTDTLTHSLPNFILVFGDEPQQKLDVIDLVRSNAGVHGFDERQSLVADGQFDWGTLTEASQSMSLFSAKQYIELELPTGKPGAEGSKILSLMAEQANPDALLLVHGPKAGKDIQNSKWFKQLDKAGIFVPCFPLEGNRLSVWLKEQMNSLGLTATPNLITFFSDYFDGNLLAAKQELQKLKLLYPDGQVNQAQIEKVVMEQSRYNVFQLVDVLLQGDAQKTVKLLGRLEVEGVEPNIILWALTREWQTLSALQFAHIQQQPLDIVWKKFRIWQNRQSLYYHALGRLHEPALNNIQTKLLAFDTAIKQSNITRPYIELCHLCLLFIPMLLDDMPLGYAD